jgi:hypothetical protein
MVEESSHEWWKRGAHETQKTPLEEKISRPPQISRTKQKPFDDSNDLLE